jgi:hypothetical protein
MGPTESYLPRQPTLGRPPASGHRHRSEQEPEYGGSVESAHPGGPTPLRPSVAPCKRWGLGKGARSPSRRRGVSVSGEVPSKILCVSSRPIYLLALHPQSLRVVISSPSFKIEYSLQTECRIR